MLALNPKRPQLSSKTTKPNILPCKITHSGPIPTASRHWNPRPSTTDSSAQTAYFRGRKLQGTVVPLPEGFEGKVLFKTETSLPQAPVQEDEEEDGEEDVPVEVKQVEEVASFDSVVVWAHEAVPGSEDVYVQGLGEWPEFAARIHDYETTAGTTT